MGSHPVTCPCAPGNCSQVTLQSTKLKQKGANMHASTLLSDNLFKNNLGLVEVIRDLFGLEVRLSFRACVV